MGPAASSLRDWLTGQLINTYPILTERDGGGATVAEQLLVTGRILPVLDGFDEIPEGLRAEAIIGINASLRTGDRLLLTSRPAEYAAAVATGDVLTAAAVVTLKDLTADDVRSYLPLTTRRTATSTTQWDPVLDRAYASPSHLALGEVLSTPLMVTLARAIFRCQPRPEHLDRSTGPGTVQPQRRGDRQRPQPPVRALRADESQRRGRLGAASASSWRAWAVRGCTASAPSGPIARRATATPVAC